MIFEKRPETVEAYQVTNPELIKLGRATVPNWLLSAYFGNGAWHVSFARDSVSLARASGGMFLPSSDGPIGSWIVNDNGDLAVYTEEEFLKKFKKIE